MAWLRAALLEDVSATRDGTAFLAHTFQVQLAHSRASQVTADLAEAVVRVSTFTVRANRLVVVGNRIRWNGSDWEIMDVRLLRPRGLRAQVDCRRLSTRSPLAKLVTDGAGNVLTDGAGRPLWELA